MNGDDTHHADQRYHWAVKARDLRSAGKKDTEIHNILTAQGYTNNGVPWSIAQISNLILRYFPESRKKDHRPRLAMETKAAKLAPNPDWKDMLMKMITSDHPDAYQRAMVKLFAEAL